MKKLAAAILVMVLAAVTPALAQEEGVVATGVIEEAGITTYQYGSHAITDEATGTFYALTSEDVDLSAYTGQRVTIYGTLVPGYESGQVEGGPPLVDVSAVEPASYASDQYSP